MKYMRLSDLQKKDIINISDGVKIGNIIDVNINDKGIITSLIADRTTFKFFSNTDEIEIYFDQIVKIGDDVILVKNN
ncbi:MAG: YlmC/YmxH family sporulation protein [Bacilli bacterium]|nr:YlmC/YmxH family sporulation protein [Bacilli bacterium]